MINYFHLIFIILVFIIWKETLPFIRNYDVEDKIKLFSKVGLVLLIVFFTLFTQSVSFLIGLNSNEIIDADLSIPFTNKQFKINEDNKEELEDLNNLLKKVKVKYSLKVPKTSYKGQTITVILLTEKGFEVFRVTDSNHIWHNGKFYKCENVDLFSHLEECLVKKDIYDVSKE